jgi:hypothetical protein
MQMGVIRNINKGPFDFLVVVIFNKDFSVGGMWTMPIEIVVKHQNGYILVFKKEVMNETLTKKVI